MKGLKHGISEGDPVICIYSQFLLRGIAEKVDNKLIKVRITNPPPGHARFSKVFPRDKVAFIQDVFTVVFSYKKGEYLLNWEDFPEENGSFEKWDSPSKYKYILN